MRTIHPTEGGPVPRSSTRFEPTTYLSCCGNLCFLRRPCLCSRAGTTAAVLCRRWMLCSAFVCADMPAFWAGSSFSWDHFYTHTPILRCRVQHRHHSSTADQQVSIEKKSQASRKLICTLFSQDRLPLTQGGTLVLPSSKDTCASRLQWLAARNGGMSHGHRRRTLNF